MPVVVTFTAIWTWSLAALACILLLSGLDDLAPVAICAFHWLFRRGRKHVSTEQTALPERRIAIFVPCWKESEVIGGMVRHNIARIRYRNFDFFLGVYPNDNATCDAAMDVACSFPHVHVAVCPKPGPTSKADCLNAIYAGMTNYERVHNVYFDTIVLHDAEDVIHSDALGVINRERAHHAMVQVPVLPLPTAVREITHGIYCDEFSEFQVIDMRARMLSRSFVPSNGVGTGFSREVLEILAAERGGLMFDPSSLTEDYDIGVQFHAAGYKQIFCSLTSGARGIVATREFFPRKMRTAIRQRTRWITGIALQAWERHGWRGPFSTKYWFWRDRKGLLTNPLSLITNVLFFAGLIDWILSRTLHWPWIFGVPNTSVVKLCVLTTGLQVFRLLLRSLCVAQLFGLAMGATVTLRCFHANLVNCLATYGAIKNYIHSKLQRKTLHWDKTDHTYPVHGHHHDAHGPVLEDVLVSCGYLTQEKLELVRAHLPADVELTEFLLANQLLTEDELCRAMSLQSGFPWTQVDVNKVKRDVVRSVPIALAKECNVIPFRVEAGRLHVAASRVPQPHVIQTLSRYTRLPVQLQLVTSINYSQLQDLL